MSSRGFEIGLRATMIEFNVDVCITLSRFDHGRVQRSASNRVDIFGGIAVIRCKVQFPISVVDEATAHRNGVLQNLIGDAELIQGVNSTGGKCQINRSSTDEI